MLSGGIIVMSVITGQLKHAYIMMSVLRLHI